MGGRQVIGLIVAQDGLDGSGANTRWRQLGEILPSTEAFQANVTTYYGQVLTKDRIVALAGGAFLRNISRHVLASIPRNVYGRGQPVIS
jgi:hypothetical protein